MGKCWPLLIFTYPAAGAVSVTWWPGLAMTQPVSVTRSWTSSTVAGWDLILLEAYSSSIKSVKASEASALGFSADPPVGLAGLPVQPVQQPRMKGTSQGVRSIGVPHWGVSGAGTLYGEHVEG